MESRSQSLRKRPASSAVAYSEDGRHRHWLPAGWTINGLCLLLALPPYPSFYPTMACPPIQRHRYIPSKWRTSPPLPLLKASSGASLRFFLNFFVGDLLSS